MEPFHGRFRGKRVLVTGHTGFKGSWLVEWLLSLGAEVTGYALAPEPEQLFEALQLAKRCDSHIHDIRDGQQLLEVVQTTRPEIVFHLAAQALVRPSYETPVYTFETNVNGTLNLLEAVRQTPSVKACVIVSSDKCYENKEQLWGYRETDPMGGHDPYSASKGACEIVTASYRRSFFSPPNTAHIASARAGNVIGGGDWADFRIVTDFVTSIRAGEPLVLRNPSATRPWQYVLEPLSGYLWLAARMMEDDGARFARAWNFGPLEASSRTVEALARRLVEAWGRGEVIAQSNPDQPHEAQRLALDCTLAQHTLDWLPTWDFEASVSRTVEWYRSFYELDADPQELTRSQIAAYQSDALRLKRAWAH